MTPKTKLAAACFILTFFAKFGAIFAGFAGFRTLAITLFVMAFTCIFTAVALCIVDMRGQEKPWEPQVPGMKQVKPGVYVRE